MDGAHDLLLQNPIRFFSAGVFPWAFSVCVVKTCAHAADCLLEVKIVELPTLV